MKLVNAKSNCYLKAYRNRRKGGSRLIRGGAAAVVIGTMDVGTTILGAGTMKEVPSCGRLGFAVFLFFLFSPISPELHPGKANWKPTAEGVWEFADSKIYYFRVRML